MTRLTRLRANAPTRLRALRAQRAIEAAKVLTRLTRQYF